MTNRSQSSTRNKTANDTSADGQGSQHAVQPGTTSSNGISLERKTYLATTYGYSPEQIDVVRNVICLSATDAELEFFLATCRRVKLDPFARQIYFIKRPQRVEDQWGNAQYVDVGKPEVSIDGLRAGAEMTGDYDGQGPVEWCGPDGKWLDVWLNPNEPPMAAKATIYRKGHREPLINVALFHEFAPTRRDGSLPQMWKKMGANQLAKCAEAGGLRRAFPRDLSGLYTDTEMEHVQATAAAYVAPVAKDANVIDAKSSPALPAPEQGAIAQLTEHDETDLNSMLQTIKDAPDRNSLASVGARITAARRKKEDARNAIERAIMERVEPALSEKWRTLPPVTKQQQ